MRSVKIGLWAALSVVVHAGAVQAAAPVVAKEPEVEAWRPVDPQNVLVVDTTKGRIIAELDPLFAPIAVERVKALAHTGFYDGLIFHRVIDGFMAQTGDPKGTGEGGSTLPDIKGEFNFRRGDELSAAIVPNAKHGQVQGLIGATPFSSQEDALMDLTADNKVAAYGLFCAGVVGMARTDAPDTANSQFFFMRQEYPGLNHKYAVLGRVLIGLDVVRSLKPGEPPKDPDKIIKARLLADIPEAERPVVEVEDTRTPGFKAKLQHDIKSGAVCNVTVRARVR